MTNPRITKKERGLLKGAIRRVFSRSELRQRVLSNATVVHSDPNRKRVTKWATCAECKKIDARYAMDVDHKIPVVALTSSFEEMTLEQLVDAVWCEEEQLQVLCEACHDMKTQAENAERRRIKKEKKLALEGPPIKVSKTKKK